MLKSKLKISNIFTALFLLFPLVLFFSYYPIISFGSTGSMNLELSLPLIWLVLFDLFAIILYFQNYHHFPKLTLKFALFIAFPTYLTISIFWSPNFLRGVLTAGIVWLIFAAIYLSYKLLHYLQPLKNKLIKSIFISTFIISAWCWLQSILDLVGLDRSQTLLCRGCVSSTFGFPHPNGFAIEPQFMGNLLLAPTLLAIFLLLNGSKDFSKKFLCISVVIFTTTLFFTFSRGAIYSFGLALILMIVLLIIKQKSAHPLLIIPILIFSFALSTNAQGIMAAVSPTNDTYLSGITKAIDQLTLGIFHLKVKTPNQNPDSGPTTKPTSPESSNPSVDSFDSAFDGYVEMSTTIRLELAASSLKVWSSSPTNLIFGVGLGGSGQAMYQAGEIDSPAEIVQNEYCEVLLELGLIGVILLVIVLVIIFKAVPHSEYQPLLLAIVLAYAISLFFFSGLPNALHIFLAPSFWPSFAPAKVFKKVSKK